MKRHYDFSKGRRGAVLPSSGKTRITIRIDDDVLDWFRKQVHDAGGGNYQTLLNTALRDYIANRDNALADSLRQMVREELAAYGRRKRPARR